MGYEIGLIVYRDSQNNWNEATNIAFINNHACVKVISVQHEQYARGYLKNIYSIENSSNEWFENYNHLRQKG